MAEPAPAPEPEEEPEPEPEPEEAAVADADPLVARFQAGINHLTAVQDEVDVLDALPANNQFGPGNPAAVRARTNLIMGIDEVGGAFQDAVVALRFERDLAVVAREGYQRYREETRLLAARVSELSISERVARERAMTNAAALEEARLEMAVLRARLRERGFEM